MDIATIDQELIRRVAVELMGFEIDPDQPWYGNQLFVRRMGEKTYWGFNPLTNANHWIMIMAKMREKGFKRFDLIVLENCTMAQFSKEFPVPFGFTGQEDNLDAGHAVCLAALDAMEAE